MQKFSAYKRRTVQQMKESLGVAKDITVDPNFDTGYQEFQSLSEELMEVGASAHIFLEQAKLWTTTSQQMAAKFDAYFQSSNSSFTTNTRKFQSANDDIANVVRKSVAIVALEQCLNPLRKFCGEKIPEMESRVAQRNDLRKDYDSYRRRLKDLESSNQQDREKLEVMRQKLESAKNQYEKCNSDLVADFSALKASREKLLINQASAMFICQQEFFSRAAKSLEDAMHGLPVGTARKTEKSIEQFVRSGGPDPESAAHAMSANRESFRVTVDLSAKVGPGASTVPPSRMPQVGNMHIGNEAAAPSSYTPPTVVKAYGASSNRPPAPPPPPSVPGMQKKTMAVATFPYEAREDGDVGFAVGDLIEVVEQDDSGWWIGVVKGKRGQFPANYVQLK